MKGEDGNKSKGEIDRSYEYVYSYVHKCLCIYIMFHKGDICRNVYTIALQRSILKNQNSVRQIVYINFGL